MSEIAEMLLSKYPSESEEDDAKHAEAFAAEFDALWKAYMDHREDTTTFWSEAS